MQSTNRDGVIGFFKSGCFFDYGAARKLINSFSLLSVEILLGILIISEPKTPSPLVFFAYNTDEYGNSNSTKFFRDIELWQFCDIMILEDGGNDQLSW